MRAGLVEDVGVGNTVSDRCRHLSVPERTPASEPARPSPHVADFRWVKLLQILVKLLQIFVKVLFWGLLFWRSFFLLNHERFITCKYTKVQKSIALADSATYFVTKRNPRFHESPSFAGELALSFGLCLGI